MVMVILTEEIGSMLLEPIGVIHTPYHRREDIPRQGRLSSELCEIEVFPEFMPALRTSSSARISSLSSGCIWGIGDV